MKLLLTLLISHWSLVIGHCVVRSNLVAGDIIAPGDSYVQYTSGEAGGTTYNSDGSQSDVQAKVDLCVAGDTVTIPSGIFSWGDDVVVDVPITIIGDGIGSTIITNTTHATSGLETPLFTITLDADERMEISDMTLIGTYISSSGSSGIKMYAGTVLATQIVIHDIRFEGFSFGIVNGDSDNAIGWGVCYDCQFHNVRITCRNSGFATSADFKGNVPDSPAWGTADYFVYEDNIITFTNWTGGPQGANYMGDTEHPMNYMVRFCDFFIGRDGAIQVDGYDMHGDAETSVNDLGAVIHNNNFYFWGSSVGSKIADIRGGVGSLVYSNTISGQSGCYMVIRANANSSDDSTTPTQTYFWANSDGSLILPSNDGTGGTLGVNYFTNAPGTLEEIAYPHPLRTP